ncbi:hypothetical protein AALB39_27050 [Lachnospiraceae bacterium 54-53]
MTRQDVINNIMASYGDYDISLDWLEDLIRICLEKGFSYQAAYNRIRMEIGTATGTREVFTIAETAEALGVSEEKVIEAALRLNREAEAAGEGPEHYYKKVDPDTIQRFCYPAGRTVRPGAITLIPGRGSCDITTKGYFKMEYPFIPKRTSFYSSPINRGKGVVLADTLRKEPL